MAELNIPAPTPLVIDMASTSMFRSWERWVENLESFFEATNVSAAGKKNALLSYLGGEDLRKILRTLPKKETYAENRTQLTAYFKPKENITFERNKFYSTAQHAGEPIAAYVTRLQDLARTCEFDNYSADQAVVDQIISRCYSSKLVDGCSENQI